MGTYSYNRQKDLDALLDQSTGYGDYKSAYTDKINQAAQDYANIGKYESAYTDDINKLQASLANRQFSYDPDQDETYQQYKKDYTRYGRQAMEDTMGKAAARTGGLASSYAASASNQTYNNYMQELASKIPELKQLAYNMFTDEGNRLQQNLQNYLTMDQNAQNAWSGNLSYAQGNLNNYLGLDQNAQNIYNTNLASLAQRIGLLQDDRTADNGIWTNNEQLALEAQKAAAAAAAAANRSSGGGGSSKSSGTTPEQYIQSIKNSGADEYTIRMALAKMQTDGLLSAAERERLYKLYGNANLTGSTSATSAPKKTTTTSRTRANYTY